MGLAAQTKMGTSRIRKRIERNIDDERLVKIGVPGGLPRRWKRAYYEYILRFRLRTGLRHGIIPLNCNTLARRPTTDSASREPLIILASPGGLGVLAVLYLRSSVITFRVSRFAFHVSRFPSPPLRRIVGDADPRLDAVVFLYLINDSRGRPANHENANDDVPYHLKIEVINPVPRATR